MDHSHTILSFEGTRLAWNAQNRSVVITKGRDWLDSADLPGRIVLWKVSDDLNLFSCASYDEGTRVASVVLWDAMAPGKLSQTTVRVPEGAEFIAVASPSGRSLAYTFFEGKWGICVVRRTPEGPKFDELHQQCGYPFRLTDTSITFELE